MCGRFAIAITLKEVEKEFGIKKINETFTPNYNVAPQQKILVVYNESGIVTLDTFRWGLIPYWAQDEKIGYKMINSRVETVAEKPSFKKSFLEGRCLIPASGFYEWKATDDGKIPYYIHLKERNLFAFAGISSTWKSPAGEVVKSCSIITTNPNKFMKTFHDRMPVVLPKKSEDKWINPEIKNKDELLQMLQSQKQDDMLAYEVSTLVNSPRNNSPECKAPV